MQSQSQRWLIQYDNEEAEALIFQHATQLHHWFAKERLVSVQLDDDDEHLTLLLLRNSSGIVSMEQDNLWVAQGYVERIVDPSELRQTNSRFLTQDEIVPYGISMVQADQVTMGATPITVCIVDTGIDLGHPDLDATLVTGADRETEDADGVTATLRWDKDTRGHGTHVAGTIMARANNGIGVRGMGQIPIFVTRGLDDNGNAFESDIREAIEQCETAGAHIVSLSLGGDRMSNAMRTLIQRLYWEKNMLIFAAAGNAGEWKMEYPASDPSVISVSAVDETEWYWDRANFGPTLELMAPGVSILSTMVNSSGAFVYAEYSGTSMAVPHASAAAALVWSHHPECTNQQIRFVLAATAKDAGDLGCDTDFGYGIVQVRDALEFLDMYPCVDATWGAVPMTGNCTVLDVPMNNADDGKVAFLAPSVAPVDGSKSEAPDTYSGPVETTDMDNPNGEATIPPSTDSPTDFETEAPTTDPTRTDPTEPPILVDSETEPPNLDDPAPMEIPEISIPETAGKLDVIPITTEIPASSYHHHQPFDPELPGALDIPTTVYTSPDNEIGTRDKRVSSTPPSNSPTTLAPTVAFLIIPPDSHESIGGRNEKKWHHPQNRTRTLRIQS